MTQAGMHEAKTRLSQLVTRAENGEEIVIARTGKPAVRLVPVERTSSMTSVRGIFRGQIEIGGGARPLPISLAHAAGVERLPWHHRDPFDRLLVAQAEVEGAVLVSADVRLSAYAVPVLW